MGHILRFLAAALVAVALIADGVRLRRRTSPPLRSAASQPR
jgi:hypothetical protein